MTLIRFVSITHRAAILFLLLSFAVLPCGASVQKGTVVTRQVRFARGRTSAVINDKAGWGTSYIYLLNARAGQTMRVSITGAPNLTVQFYPPEAGSEPLEGAEEVKDWTGELPETGRYAIFVSHTQDGVTNAPFKLQISVR